MTLVAVSSIVRRASLEEHSGFLRVVDVERGSVAATLAVPESPLRADDPNPRGGLRGTRGVSAHGDRLVVARADRIFILDRSWRPIHEVSHPWMGGIHDIFADEGGIWVTATAASLLVRCNWEGDVVCTWSWADDPELSRALGFRDPPSFDDSLDYRVPFAGIGLHDTVHLNGVIGKGSQVIVSLGLIRSPASRGWRRAKSAISRGGSALPVTRRLVSVLRRNRQQHRETRRTIPALGSKGSSHAIVEIQLTDEGRPGAARTMWRQRNIETPKHNIWIAGKKLLFNDSDAGELVGVDLRTGQVEYRTSIPGSPSFVRGLCALSEGEVVVGSQRPAAIYRVRLGDRSISKAIELDGKPWETVYAICPVPDGFSTEKLDGSNDWAKQLMPERARSSAVG